MLVGFFWGSKREGKIFSGDPTVFDGPAGEPRWNGNLPEKVDDYTEPRYVYENLCESTEYLPQNGRIIGYRISSNLVLHSHCLESINPPRLNKYIKRFDKLVEKYGDKAIGVKVYFDKTNPEVIDITPLKEVCEYAKSKKLKVMVHCSNSPTPMTEIINTLSSGDILTHAFHGGDSSCLENDFEALKLANQKGVIIDAGFAGHVHTDFNNFKKSVDAGLLPATISTDITCFSAYKRGGKYGMTMCMSIAKALGMSEEEIFRASTTTPAKILGKEDDWGSLKVGKIADIAVFDYADEGFDLTDNAGNKIKSNMGYRCILTVCDGQVVYRY